MQDSERFGTKLEPLETSAALSRVPVKMATAVSIAAAEPDATVQETPRSTAAGRETNRVEKVGGTITIETWRRINAGERPHYSFPQSGAAKSARLPIKRRCRHCFERRAADVAARAD